MGLFQSVLIAVTMAAAAVSALPGEKRFVERRNNGGGTCSSSAFEPVTYVGGHTNNFCESGYGGNGQAITTLTFWYVPDYVVGIQGIYSGGEATPVYGRQANNVVSIDVNYNEGIIFDGAILWTGGASGYVHTVYMGNSHSGSIIAGEAQPNQNGLTRYPQKVGSGVLYGFSGSTAPGSSGPNINGLGFLFATN